MPSWSSAFPGKVRCPGLADRGAYREASLIAPADELEKMEGRRKGHLGLSARNTLKVKWPARESTGNPWPIMGHRVHDDDLSMTSFDPLNVPNERRIRPRREDDGVLFNASQELLGLQSVDLGAVFVDRTEVGNELAQRHGDDQQRHQATASAKVDRSAQEVGHPDRQCQIEVNQEDRFKKPRVGGEVQNIHRGRYAEKNKERTRAGSRLPTRETTDQTEATDDQQDGILIPRGANNVCHARKPPE